MRLPVLRGSEGWGPPAWFERMVEVRRAAGDVREPRASLLELSDLGREWEWEETPEVTLAVVDSVDHAVSLCNAHSPKLVATLVADDDIEHDRFWATVDTPFVGNGFTRWVDGPYAFGTPELGLSNWESGRLLARSGVLAGDTVHTLRTRAWQDRPDVHR